MRGHARFRELEWVGEGGESALADALGSLDGEERLVLALLFVEGLNEAEVAAALDRSVDQVRSLAGAAQRALAISAGAEARRAA